MKKSIFIVSAIAMLVSFSSCQGVLTGGGKKNNQDPAKGEIPSAPGPIADPMSASMKITAIPEAVDIFVDASGSMKGYIDGVQGTLKNVVPNLIPNLMNNDRMGLSTDNINCYTIYNSKLKKQDTDKFGQSITDASIFNGNSTEVHEMFKVVANSIVENPKHVGIIVSDCILSFPGNQLSADREKNYNNIDVLSTEVTRAMTVLYNNGMNVSVVKYTSDFNGNYYYDYHNQKLSIARNQTMINRPFYLVLVGKRELVDAMFNKYVIPQSYKEVFSFNKEGAKPRGEFLRAAKASSWIPTLVDNVPTIKTDFKANKNIDAAYAYMTIDKFEVPSYLQSRQEEIMGAPKCDGKYIASVSRVKQSDVEKDLIEVKGKKPDLTGKYIYRISFKDNEVLKDLTLFNDRIYFEAPEVNALSSEIEKDDAASLNALSDLEGKTFMFNHLIDGLRNAYSGGGAPLAEIEITIKTK